MSGSHCLGWKDLTLVALFHIITRDYGKFTKHCPPWNSDCEVPFRLHPWNPLQLRMVLRVESSGTFLYMKVSKICLTLWHRCYETSRCYLAFHILSVGERLSNAVCLMPTFCSSCLWSPQTVFHFVFAYWGQGSSCPVHWQYWEITKITRQIGK